MLCAEFGTPVLDESRQWNVADADRKTAEVRRVQVLGAADAALTRSLLRCSDEHEISHHHTSQDT